MADVIRMRCPVHASAISVGGAVYEADATGHVVVPAADEAECLRHGFVRVPDAPPAPPASRRAEKAKESKP
jgi:hypothetical protein